MAPRVLILVPPVAVIEDMVATLRSMEPFVLPMAPPAVRVTVDEVISATLSLVSSLMFPAEVTETSLEAADTLPSTMWPEVTVLRTISPSPSAIAEVAMMFPPELRRVISSSPLAAVPSEVVETVVKVTAPPPDCSNRIVLPLPVVRLVTVTSAASALSTSMFPVVVPMEMEEAASSIGVELPIPEIAVSDTVVAVMSPAPLMLPDVLVSRLAAAAEVMEPLMTILPTVSIATFPEV